MAEEQDNNQNNQPPQSNENTSLNRPQLGMDLDSSPITVPPTAYTLAVNANIQSIDGNMTFLTNEPSNILCSRFKPGYLVIGRLYVPIQKTTIFWLVNPTSGQSEIGMIKNMVYDDESDRQVNCKDCNNPLIEDTPLEQTIQKERCFYQTIVNAPCLNLNINYPVDATYEIGVNVDTQLPDCNQITVFFTDFFNPRRYININQWPQQIVGFDPNNCDQPIYNGLLDCDAILIDKNYTDGCIVATEIVAGGQNTAGTYQVGACYANPNGAAISDFFVVSNPVSIWDSRNAITTKTNYISGQAIEITISNIDTRFLYLNLAIIKTVNGVTVPYLVGTFPINSAQFLYTYTGTNAPKEKELTLNELLDRRTHYTATKGLMNSNSILFSYNNIEQRIINLQPVMDLIHPQWQTIEVDEGTYPNTFYSNGTNVANYLGFERDEIYTLGIEFRKTNGYKLPTFIFTGPSSSYFQSQYGVDVFGQVGSLDPTAPYGNTNPDVLIQPNCCSANPSECQLNQLWEVYNIATNLGYGCGYKGATSSTGAYTQTEYCTTTYNDGTSPVPCCPNTSTCGCTPVGSPILVSPAQTITINTYNTSPTPTPIQCPNDLPVQYVPGCSFFGYISGTVLTVTSVNNGIIVSGQNVTGTGVSSNTIIVSFGTGSGGVGTYNVNNSQTVGSAGSPQEMQTSAPNPCISTQSATQFVPQNTTCDNPYLLYATNNNTCAQDLQAGNQSLKPTVFFGTVGVGSSLPNCPISTSTTQTANQTWYTFTSVSTVVGISISSANGTNFTIVAYGPNPTNPNTGSCPSTGGVPIGCATSSGGNAYMLLGNGFPSQTYTPGTIYNAPLQLGGTYTFVVYSTSLAGGNLWDWGTICINTPNPNGTTSETVPAVFQQTYSYCVNSTVTTVNIPNCDIQTYQYGDFSYWQSTQLYPNNPDVWGSLCNTPIRHFKFPDNTISPFHNNPLNTQYGAKNKIYPLGIRIDVNQIKTALNQAVSLGLISEAEKVEITGYSIKRGNRRTNRSIQAKGYLYDVWSTPQLQENFSDPNSKYLPYNVGNTQQLEYYPNYMFNDVHPDNFILNQEGGSAIQHPYNTKNYVNARYTFHSPNTSFNQPFLIDGQELKLETIESGLCNGLFTEQLWHSRYILLSKNAYILAEVLAGVEIVLEASIAASSAGEGPAVLGTSTGSIITYAIEFTINLALGFATNQGKYTQQWADIFQKLGTPRNPSIYYVGVGWYNNSTPIPNNLLSVNGFARKRALINNSRYLTSGSFQFLENGNTLFFNNFERESSVYLSTDGLDSANNIIFNTNTLQTFAFQNPSNIAGTIAAFSGVTSDNSRQSIYNSYSGNCGLNVYNQGNIASYYASIKNYVPDQYGTIDQIEWIDTGYCGEIDWTNSSQSSVCNTIFGGDTFINRFGFKRKMPFFTDDRVSNKTFTIGTDVFYRDLGNVGFPHYFFNSTFENTTQNATAAFFGFTPPNTNFLCKQNNFFFQIGTMPWAMYGIQYFLCESDYNVDLRYGEDELAKNFYPYASDVVNWTQQYQVPIYNDNYYFYNNDYSKQNKENFAYILKYNFSNLTDACQTFHPTRVIYSPQGTEFWLTNLSSDFYDFPREDGAIIVMKELEELKVLVLQEQSNKIFNAYVTMQTNAGIVQVSSSKGIFQDNKPSQIYATDLGFAGCQNREIVSTPHGTFYIDSRNPAILSVTRTMYGRNITNDVLEPKEGKSKTKLWFRQNLPFNIIKDYPDVDIDNAYKYFGIATVWDNRFDRLFITKRDARVKPEWKNRIIYQNFEFYLVGANNSLTHILPTDSKYFNSQNWTVAYNPALNEFVSWYTFFPNYYISQEETFQSGINYPIDGNLGTIGVWNHGQTEKSFQVFYGELNPWVFEYVVKDTITNTYLKNVVLNLEMYRYQNNLNWYMTNSKFPDEAIVYNQTQSTGLLKLVPVEKNNLFQLVNYPQFNIDNTTVLVEDVSNLWQWNWLMNLSRLNGNPLMVYEKSNPMFKVVNNDAINYTQQYIPNRMRGDYFSVRVANNIYSNFKILMKHGLNFNVNTI